MYQLVSGPSKEMRAQVFSPKKGLSSLGYRTTSTVFGDENVVDPGSERPFIPSQERICA